jgi:ribosomal-protein-alanine N-acetyltransferase
MSNDSIRPATEDDLARILEIEAIQNPTPWTLAALKAEIVAKNSHFWVMTDDETDQILYGFLIFRFVAGEAHLLQVGVDPRIHKVGYGGKLMRAMINFVTRNGGERIFLEVRKINENAISFYQHLGFVIVTSKPSFYSDGADAYSMSFKLNTNTSLEVEE